MFLRHRKLIQLSLLAGLSIASASVCAHAALNLPTARQVLERYVKATGGREALLKHQSMTIHGRYQVPSRKLDFETVTYMKSGKALWKFLLPDGKEYVSGYTGKIAWDMDSSGKVTIHHGDIVKSVARDADMYYHLHVMKYFRTMAVVDIQEFNDHLCYHLKGVNKWGQVNEHFYDTRSGLLQGYAFNTAWRGGKGNATVLFDDYKNFGGVLMPAKTVSHEDGDVAISLISAVTYDDVPDALFELPEAVKKAMAAAKDKQREKAG